MVRALRFLRIIPRADRAAKPGPGVRAYVGPSALAAFARPFAWKTETDNALDSGLDHERAKLKASQGIFFSWLQPSPIVTLRREYTQDIAKHDLENARKFLTYAIPVRTNPQYLYEDIEGASNHENITIDFNVFNINQEYIIFKSSINKAIFGILSCYLGMLTMLILYKTKYLNFQRNNVRELNIFLERYLRVCPRS